MERTKAIEVANALYELEELERYKESFEQCPPPYNKERAFEGMAYLKLEKNIKKLIDKAIKEAEDKLSRM